MQCESLLANVTAQHRNASDTLQAVSARLVAANEKHTSLAQQLALLQNRTASLQLQVAELSQRADCSLLCS